METITKKMVEDGLMAKVIIPVLDEDGLKAHIGEYWFYFGGNYPFSNINTDTNPDGADLFLLAEEIYIVLNELKTENETEYLYYFYCLCENI